MKIQGEYQESRADHLRNRNFLIFYLNLRLPYIFLGLSRPNDVARPV